MNRTTYACARCFRLKRKCDSGSPACSRCLQAGVECVGIDRVTAKPVPRSLVQYLEQSIAGLEIELHEAPDVNIAESSSSAQPIITQKLLPRELHEFLGDLAQQSHFLDFLDAWPFSSVLADSLSTPSNLPTADENPARDTSPSTNSSTHIHSSTIVLEAIPRHVADMLVKVYVEKVLPQYPFLLADDILAHCQNVYSDNARASRTSPVSSFIVSLILAISTMTSKSTDYLKAFSLSDSLFNSGMACFSSVPWPSIQCLQCTMLICQYANFRPSTANIWLAKATAMRMAIALGLHRDPDPEYQIFDANTLDLRRQIFWVLYSMDRSITVPTFRPLDIADEHIDVAFPQPLDDESYTFATHDERLNSRRRRQQWINHVLLRQLESEIFAVNFEHRELSNSPYQSWMDGMDLRLRDWRQDVASMSEAGPDWFDFVMSTVQFYFHMPCPRNPTPNIRSCLVCYDAAVVTASGYLGMITRGFLKFDWHCAHQCFASAALILQNAQLYLQYHSHDQLSELIDQFSTVFSMLSERWPAFRSLAEVYEARKLILFEAVSPLNGLHQTLMPENPEASDLINAVGSHADFLSTSNHLDISDMDDSTFWGPVDDSFKKFMEMDWDQMGSDAEVLHWAL